MITLIKVGRLLLTPNPEHCKCGQSFPGASRIRRNVRGRICSTCCPHLLTHSCLLPAEQLLRPSHTGRTRGCPGMLGACRAHPGFRRHRPHVPCSSILTAIPSVFSFTCVFCLMTRRVSLRQSQAWALSAQRVLSVRPLPF